MYDLSFKGFTLTQQEDVNEKTTIIIQQGDSTVTLTPEEMGLIVMDYISCYKIITNNGRVRAIRMQ